MSSGGKRPWVLLVSSSFLPLCMAYACGGQTRFDGDDGSSGRGGKSARADGGDGDPSRGGTGGSSDGGPLDDGSGASDADPGDPDTSTDAALDVYEDPGCPDAEPPPGVIECDVFNEPNGCAEGEGCYPYVDHPFGEGCGLQTFGAVCLPAGSGVQGSECGNDNDGCAPGFLCVVGAQTGNRCVKICDLNAANTCGNGLICGETDVEGVGVCA